MAADLRSQFVPLPTEHSFEMSDHGFKSITQPVDVGFAYGSLSPVVITTVTMDAVVPYWNELHQCFLRRLIWKDGRAECTPIVQIDLHEVMLH